MYLLLKLLHLLAVVMFLGNITTGLFWHRHAWRTRDPKLLAHTVSGIIRADRLFTTPSVLILAVAGIAAAIVAGFSLLRTGWILWTIVLFVISGFIFGTRLAPLQRQMLAAASASSFDAEAYARLATRWETAGAIAVATPLMGFVLMVLKPI